MVDWVSQGVGGDGSGAAVAFGRFATTAAVPSSTACNAAVRVVGCGSMSIWIEQTSPVQTRRTVRLPVRAYPVAASRRQRGNL